jgi:phage baseplate assembly protein gpV
MVTIHDSWHPPWGRHEDPNDEIDGLHNQHISRQEPMALALWFSSTRIVGSGTMMVGDETLAVGSGTLTVDGGTLMAGNSTLVVISGTLMVDGGTLMSDG